MISFKKIKILRAGLFGFSLLIGGFNYFPHQVYASQNLYKEEHHGETFLITAKIIEENRGVIAKPIVVIHNGQKGMVNFGDKIPIHSKTDKSSTPSHFQDIGTKLEVTPTIESSTGDIKMQIKAEISAITAWQFFGDKMEPQISSFTTVVSPCVKSGQCFVIRGMTHTIMITPYIMTDDVNVRDIYDRT